MVALQGPQNQEMVALQRLKFAQKRLSTRIILGAIGAATAFGLFFTLIAFFLQILQKW